MTGHHAIILQQTRTDSAPPRIGDVLGLVWF
jgi:hypothetical protein